MIVRCPPGWWKNSSFFSLIRFFQNRAKKEKKDDFESFFRTERRRGKNNECFVAELFKNFNIEYVMRCYAKKMKEQLVGREVVWLTKSDPLYL